MSASGGASADKIPALWTKNYILMCVSAFLFWASYMILMPIIPQYSAYMGANKQLIGIINGSFTFAAFLMRPYIGRECDRRGRKAILLLALAALMLTVFGYILVPSLIVLFFLRIINGGVWSACSTSSTTLVADLVPQERRGEGMGYYGMFTTLAMAVGPALGISILAVYNYAGVYFASIALAAVALLFALALKIEKYVPLRGGDKLKLFEKRALKTAVMMFFMSFTYGGVTTFIPLYAAERGIANTSFFFVTYALTVFLVRFWVGRYYDTKGPRPIVILSLLCLAASTGIASQADAVRVFFLSALFFGLGYGALQPTLLALSVEGIEPERRGAANATVMAAFDLGSGLGTMILGSVANYSSYSVMYLGAAGTSLSGLLLYLLWRGRSLTGS